MCMEKQTNKLLYDVELHLIKLDACKSFDEIFLLELK